MLHFNAASAPGSGPSSAGSVHSQQQQQQNGRDETYKVLVLDSFTKDIIAPLLKVGGADQLKWKTDTSGWEHRCRQCVHVFLAQRRFLPKEELFWLHLCTIQSRLLHQSAQPG